MPIAGPNWTPWDLANLQQQQQGLQPLADYGQTQLAIALNDRARQQRADEEARQALMAFGYRQQLARQQEDAAMARQKAELAFKGTEGVADRASREKIAGEAAQRYADLFRHQDEAQNRKDAAARLAAMRKLGYTPKDGEDIDAFEARALQEQTDKERNLARSHKTKRDTLDEQAAALGAEIDAEIVSKAHNTALSAVKQMIPDQASDLAGKKTPQDFYSWVGAIKNKTKAGELINQYETAYNTALEKVRPDASKILKQRSLSKQSADEDALYKAMVTKNPDIALSEEDQPANFIFGNRTAPIAQPGAFVPSRNVVMDPASAFRGARASGAFDTPDAATPAPQSTATNFGLPDRLTFDDFKKFTDSKLSTDQRTAAVNAYYKAIGRRFGFPDVSNYGGSTVARGSVFGDPQAAAVQQMFRDHPELNAQIDAAFKTNPELESDLYKSALIEATRTPREDRGGDFFGNPVASTFGVPAYKPRGTVSVAPSVAPVIPPSAAFVAPTTNYNPDIPIPEFNPYIPLIPYR